MHIKDRDELKSRLTLIEGSPVDRVLIMHNTLVDLFEEQVLKVLKLFAHLYFFASDAYLHEICDEIDQYIHEFGGEDMKSYLEAWLRLESDKAVRSRLNAWIQGLP